LLTHFENVEKKAKLSEESYKTKPIRRLAIIDNSGSKYDEKNEKVQFVLDCMKVRFKKEQAYFHRNMEVLRSYFI
jgi:hypothetical protein